MMIPKLRKRRPSAVALMAVGIVLALTGCISKIGGPNTEQRVLDKDDIQLVTVIQTSTNPYMLQWAAGSQAYAESVRCSRSNRGGVSAFGKKNRRDDSWNVAQREPDSG